MKSFNYFLPETNLFFGKDSLKIIGTEVKKLGKKVLLVTGRKSMGRLGFVKKVVGLLEEEGLRVAHYGKVMPNPTVKMVNQGGRKAIENDCDVIVGLGGGSAIDTAKNIAVVAGHSKNKRKSIWEFAGVHAKPLEITQETLPIVAITSTSGTGSHVSRFAVVTNEKTNEKIGIISPFLYPKLSIVDTDVLSHMPSSLTSKTGFDALTHVMESFVSKRSNPVTDLFCLRAMKLIFHYLPKAYDDGNDIEAREKIALADTFAGWCITTSRPVLPHALSHPVSAFYPKIDHGIALAALTPQIMRFNIERGDEEMLKKYCQIATIAGENIHQTSRKNALKSVMVVQELLKKIELDFTLGTLAVKKNILQNMVESAFKTMRGTIEANPVPVSKDDALRLYNESM